MGLLLALSLPARSQGAVSGLGWAPYDSELSPAAPRAAWSLALLAVRSAGGRARLRSSGADAGSSGLGAPEGAALGSAAPLS
ncbi:unnamed protein product [Rangifer tarandus platyrhynchus]|uniref:Uncharacterized protein n=1 Tax=Rangifer tarandus platyrhynchus TaxID=3082113 RepID=A0ABN8ZSI6_RANTA|nr:unnamed protein product [Rangifer tarandus platyrhynchus]